METPEVFLEPFLGAVADIRPNTQVILEKLQATMAATVLMKRTTIIDLKKGTVVSLIDPAGKNINSYSIRTPKGLAKAQGTSFAITVGDPDMSVTATADTVTSSPPPARPIRSAPAMSPSPRWAASRSRRFRSPRPSPPIPRSPTVVQTAMNTVSNIVQNNIGTIASNSATNLISQVVGVASAALPAQAASFETQAVTAVSAPTSSTGGNAAAAVGAVTAAIITSAPTQSSAVAVAGKQRRPGVHLGHRRFGRPGRSRPGRADGFGGGPGQYPARHAPGGAQQRFCGHRGRRGRRRHGRRARPGGRHRRAA